MKEERVKEAFKDTPVNVTTEGHKHLGAALGSRSYACEYISEKVDTGISGVTKLAESQPQACYAAYNFGLNHRWMYFLRKLLEPLEKEISDLLIPAITKHACNENDRNIISLPQRYGGLGMTDLCTEVCQDQPSNKLVVIEKRQPKISGVMSKTLCPKNLLQH